MRKGQELPDMTYIRREIPIADVARELGIRVSGRNTAHCWRVGAHQNGDRSPSLSFRRNRAKCYVCDGDAMSTIDLVIRHEGFDPSTALREATAWLCARWPVPTIAKNTKLARPQRWAASPVGLSSFPLEQFVRSGVWTGLDDAGRAVLSVLFCFSEKGEVAVSYRGLARYSGMKSDATIAKVLRHFKNLGIIESLPRSKNFRDVGRYRFTLDSERFQAVLAEVHARLKLESGAERELRSQSRALSVPHSESRTPKALYPGTSVFSGCSTNQVHTSPSCSVNVKTDAAPNGETVPSFEDAGIDNKEIYESAHFTPLKCEDSATQDEEPPILREATENKDTCTSAHFSTVKCEENAPAEVTPLVSNEKPPARWKSPTFSVLSEAELADKVARSVTTARQWSEIAGRQ
jgi:hypothetical protein